MIWGNDMFSTNLPNSEFARPVQWSLLLFKDIITQVSLTIVLLCKKVEASTFLFFRQQSVKSTLGNMGAGSS